jgi:hypothetical protein
MIRNDVEVEQVLGFVDLIRENPCSGIVTARTRHRWDGGVAVAWSAEEFTVAGEVLLRARDHTARLDMPAELGGRDSGPAPGEMILAGLGASISQVFLEKAALDGIEVQRLP